MSFKWLENLLSKDTQNESLDKPSDPMGLVGPLPYMKGGGNYKNIISEIINIKPSFMKGGEQSSYLQNVIRNEKSKVDNFKINEFLPNLINKVKNIQNGG